MKIAIDESGDSGRKFWRGSSRFFILTAVIVPDNELCGKTCEAIEFFKEHYNGGRELHFAHNSHEQHASFLDYVHDEEFVFASIVIDKRKLVKRKPYIFRRKMILLKFAFEHLFRRLKPWLDNPVVLVDTNGSKHFNRALSRHLMKLFGSRHKGDFRALKYVRSVDSKHEPLVQLADYVSGAIHHDIDGRHPNSDTFDTYLKDKGKVYFI
jgi:hypothetical protein